MELEYKVVKIAEKDIRLILFGDIGMDLKALKNLKTVLDDLTIVPERKLVIDFKNVKFISSNGISMIIRAYKRIQQSNGVFEIYNMSSAIFSTFELLGLTEMVTIKYDSSDKSEEIYNETLENDQAKKKCPYCMKIIESRAIRCPYCYKVI